MTNTNIPFLDLNALHAQNEAEYIELFTREVKTGRFISGPEVTEFEKESAQFCDARQRTGVSNGNDNFFCGPFIQHPAF